MIFLPTDLGISDQAILQITNQLANAANPAPITDAIARQVQKVTDYTFRYAVPDERVKRLVRILVLWDLYSNPALGVMPPNIALAYKDALQELTDIRDGKFHDLILTAPPDPNLSQPMAGFGSDTQQDLTRT